jgi:hypothetical protein
MLGIDLEKPKFPQIGKNDVKWIEMSNQLPEKGG